MSDDELCGCDHPRYMHLNGFDWCKGGGWYDAHGKPCYCRKFHSLAEPNHKDGAAPELPPGDP